MKRFEDLRVSTTSTIPVQFNGKDDYNNSPYSQELLKKKIRNQNTSISSDSTPTSSPLASKLMKRKLMNQRSHDDSNSVNTTSTTTTPDSSPFANQLLLRK